MFNTSRANLHSPWSIRTSARSTQTMITLTSKDKMATLFCGIVFLNLSLFALGGETKSADSTKPNSVEKQFKKSTALDTDQEFTITAGAPGTYNYFCSVHPKMTGTIVVEK